MRNICTGVLKNPPRTIRFFNAKGFYFKKSKENIHICSIYSKYPVGVALAPKLQAYLFSSNDLHNVLENQPNVLHSIKNKGQDHLKNLWSSYLIERGQYKKAAYLLELEGARPNLPRKYWNSIWRTVEGNPAYRFEETCKCQTGASPKTGNIRHKQPVGKQEPKRGTRIQRFQGRTYRLFKVQK